ncbi:Trehalose utilization [Rubripirellula lacrimiformis]|uniref:Trehalose utilization n=1 Tax=Rubripirellula lacrimiformis TaxID=1930273 RepID=A0A517N9K3_9BACT|nr:ThuA domain-containing protein [Rubripirellula lacrimiformis]QDT03814.1 Trehalose utilization [Rubripirellula lacrimiformis]
MFRVLIASFVLCLGQCAASAQSAEADSTKAKSLKILLVTGGCCHDYDFQTKALQLAFQKQNVDAVWTVVNDGGSGTDAQIDLYDKADWAAGFDVVIHNECFAATKDPEYIRRITKAHHDGANAVVIHCAMHTYRDAEIDDWREFLGVTSRRHDHQSNYKIDVVAKGHPIMKGYPADHVSAMDELYIIEKLWPRAKALATSVSERDGKAYPVLWINRYGKARVFGTTYGHSNETFEDDVFLGSVVRGTQWAAGHLKPAGKKKAAAK